MKTTPYLVATTFLLMAFASCASTDHGHTTPSKSQVAMTPPTSQSIELPRNAGTGEGREISVLLDQKHLKLVTIALRAGTPLTPHSTPVPVTIQVLEGEGVIHVGGKPWAVTEGSLVSLAANDEHDVVPKAGSDVLLLVHYLRSAQ